MPATVSRRLVLTDVCANGETCLDRHLQNVDAASEALLPIALALMCERQLASAYDESRCDWSVVVSVMSETYRRFLTANFGVDFKRMLVTPSSSPEPRLGNRAPQLQDILEDGSHRRWAWNELGARAQQPRESDPRADSRAAGKTTRLVMMSIAAVDVSQH